MLLLLRLLQPLLLPLVVLPSLVYHVQLAVVQLRLLALVLERPEVQELLLVRLRLAHRRLRRQVLPSSVVLLPQLLALHPAHEVRVARVYVPELDLDQVLDHLVRLHEAAAQQPLDHLLNLVLEVVKPLNLRDVDLVQHPAQLLVHQVGALQRRQLQPGDLLPDEQQEGALGHEQARPDAVRVLDRRPDVLVGQDVEGVQLLHGPPEGLVEHVGDPGASEELPRGEFEAPAVQHVLVRGGELGDEGQDEIVLGFLGLQVVELAVLREVVLLELLDVDDGFADHREGPLDVLDEVHVEGLDQVGHAHLVGALLVALVVLEVLLLLLELLGDGLVGLDASLVAHDHAHVAELERVGAVLEVVEGVAAVLEEVELREDADGADAVGVDAAGELEAVGGGKVGGGLGDGEDEAVGVADEG